MKYNKQHDGDKIMPQMEGYKMACCDCGLVHKMNFEVVAARPSKSAGFITTSKPRSRQNLRVVFEVSRDNRATAAKRRKYKGKSL